MFSPPAWGWSAEEAAKVASKPVLPTRVGMVREMSAPINNGGRSPHPRGDGPPSEVWDTVKARFSPPAWGWSALTSGVWPAGSVLPTRVGMVRGDDRAPGSGSRSPHPRGDGPSL